MVVMKVTGLFVSMCFAASAQTAPAPSDSSVIQALLSEVHQLRLAIERTNSIGPRIQLAVERVKIQQQVVSRLSDQLEGVRRDLDSRQAAETRSAEQIRNAESEINQTTDPNKRKTLEGELKDFRPMMEQMQKTTQLLQAREADLSSRLRSEQATLDGLNDRLNQIERSLPQ
jgi:chromosome segregation ATPase